MTLTAAALLAFGFYVQGSWLEGRAYARHLEWLRLTGIAALAWYGALTAGSWTAETAGWLSGYAAISAICLLWAASRHRDSLSEAPGERPALP